MLAECSYLEVIKVTSLQCAGRVSFCTQCTVESISA